MSLVYAQKLYGDLSKDFEQRKKHQEEGRRPSDRDILNVLSVDLDIAENSKSHRTDQYEISRTQPYRLVVRRGQEFRLTLHCNRDYHPEKDAVLLEFGFGVRPTVEALTKRLLEVHGVDFELTWKWGAKAGKMLENRLEILVKSSGNAPVGEWVCRVHTGRRENKLVSDTYVAYAIPSYIFILFNPWCLDDPVYMEDEAWKKDYVLRDNGAIWQGAKELQYSSTPWNFGQFEDASLFAALVCLRQGEYLSDADRADPVVVSRKLTAAINDNVVRGKWSEPYSDGTKPWEWTGSVAILEEYMNNPNQAVRYGQCWVFSAVLVTLCRALGIPCRSVTNIRSAHDTDRTLTIDHVYVRDSVTGRFEEESTGDSVWNFHVWNEFWSKRTDLPPGNDGWQAHDATPQEMSHGRYQCGPMSVAAIRRGEVRLNYDGWFIYGEVNADVVSWYYMKDSAAPTGRRLVDVSTQKQDVGRAVITSKLGAPFTAENITSNYKPVEGSQEERKTIRHAVRAAVAEERSDILELFKSKELHDDDVEFTLSDLKMIEFGDPIHAEFAIRNNGKETRTVELHLDLLILRYTGVAHTILVSEQRKLKLKPKSKDTVLLDAIGPQYGHLLLEHSQMCVDAVATVLETEQIFAKRDIFQVQKPTIYVEGEKSALVNIPTTVTVYFNNPINNVIRNCSLKIEGCGLNATLNVKCPKEIAGMGSFQTKQSVVPKRSGERSLLAVFNADELANIRGTHSFEVQHAL